LRTHIAFVSQDPVSTCGDFFFVGAVSKHLIWGVQNYTLVAFSFVTLDGT
jgi:hypothetical protein